MGRLALPLIVCVLLGRACCGTTTAATPVTTTATATAASSSSGPESQPESTAAPPHREPTTAETLDADAAPQRDATIDQVLAELDGLYQSAGRAATAGPFAALTNTLTVIQASIAAVSSRLDAMHASQLELRERLGALEHSEAEAANRIFQSLAETSTRVDGLAESQTEVSSRLTEFQTEVSSRFDAVQTALSADRDGLRRWQTETDDTLTSMRQGLANLTGGLGDWRASAESAQTALPEQVAAVLQQSPTCSGHPNQSAVQTQLEDILTAVSRIPKAVLGKVCGRDTDCSRWLPEATCSARSVCTCRDGYRRVSELQCRQHSRLDEVCLEDADCQTLAPDSTCRNNTCSCGSGLWHYNNTECRSVAGVNMGGRCVGDQDCQSRLNHQCISGTCSCETRTYDDYEYRLVGGPSCSEGNVELRRAGGAWGLVCDDSWSASDVNVLCRSLGFSSGQTTTESRYGRGTNFHMDNVECSGSEEHLLLCPYHGWGRHDCGSGEVAGVRCQN